VVLVPVHRHRAAAAQGGGGVESIQELGCRLQWRIPLSSLSRKSAIVFSIVSPLFSRLFRFK
jgi:hypothetical protein